MPRENLVFLNGPWHVVEAVKLSGESPGGLHFRGAWRLASGVERGWQPSRTEGRGIYDGKRKPDTRAVLFFVVPGHGAARIDALGDTLSALREHSTPGARPAEPAHDSA